MGCQRLIVLTACTLFIKDYVSAQYATVTECATIARPVIQSAGQYILPAIIQPIIPGFDSYCPDLSSGYNNYCNSPASSPGYPPIIYKDNDDFLRNLLYFLIFSMGNKKGGCSNTSSGGCSSNSGQCQYCCSCGNCSKNNSKDSDSSSAPIYIPVPIAIPVYTGSDGCRYIDGFCDDILIQESCGQCNCLTCNGKDTNEISLIIKGLECM